MAKEMDRQAEAFRSRSLAGNRYLVEIAPLGPGVSEYLSKGWALAVGLVWVNSYPAFMSQFYPGGDQLRPLLFVSFKRGLSV